MSKAIVPFGVLLVLLGFFVRLSGTALDALIIANLCLSLLLLFGVLFVQDTLKLSTFPTWILLLTVYRLMLNISSTREILLTAQPGSIIPFIGEVVISNDLLIGLLLFIVLTLIQLVVIAKGAERVAEVSARFTLDALPGKQMSIDADLRTGLIDQTEAKKLRCNLHTESKFYGALDGAMKFVKGDAIIAIIITLVNLIAGITLGVVRHDLSFAGAIEKYAILTIGDGILSQIPAIVNALSAGIIVTRVVYNQQQTLAAELMQQISSNRLATYIIITLLVVLMLSGLLPFWPSLIILCLFIWIPILSQSNSAVPEDRNLIQEINSPIKIIIPKRIQDDIEGFDSLLKNRVFQSYGLIFESFLYECHAENNFIVIIKGQASKEISTQESLEQISKEVANHLFENSIDYFDDRFTRCLLDYYELRIPEIIKYLIPDKLSLTELTIILKGLLISSINLSQFEKILQTVSENIEFKQKPGVLQGIIREKLAYQLSKQYADHDSTIRAVTLEPELDLQFLQVQQNENIDLSFINQLVQELGDITKKYPQAILLASRQSRLFITQCLKNFNINIPVLAYSEIDEHFKVSSVAHVQL